MNPLPNAILFDLTDTILSALGQAEDQWNRVIGSFAEQLAPHQCPDIVAAIQAYSRYLWADQARHKDWRHRIGEARRHIVANAFAELEKKAGHAVPPPELLDPVDDRVNQAQAAELRMLPWAHLTLDLLNELRAKLAP